MWRSMLATLLVVLVTVACASPSTTLVNSGRRMVRCASSGSGYVGAPQAVNIHDKCVRDMLRYMGYTVIATIDPLVALRSARLPGLSIQLLLTDVVMPLMGGGQLAQEFRKIRPEAKVLFMSAYNVEAVEAYRVQLASGEPFLKKPFTIANLQTAVKAALVYRPPAAWLRAHPGH